LFPIEWLWVYGGDKQERCKSTETYLRPFLNRNGATPDVHQQLRVRSKVQKSFAIIGGGVGCGSAATSILWMRGMVIL
jgi:hypothetical protein